ncbi:hypothetical protein ISN45_Aa05g012000 [Arabidopsis thaliana x Arabidopsis arenosa]|uniref:Uncharacterized protein n=1 Tax=Arabidopsis thaliana x Arabidopsis arenosa TaxID=1240361 RepID=A0A8T1ZMF7_9BRAS|nr:hypothetical protein ISN45_Aa05g012000 [Arabidopsis thaliana x Arabidopsis arenosa]
MAKILKEEEEKQYNGKEPLMHNLEPPLSIYFKLDKLKGYSHIQHTPSREPRAGQPTKTVPHVVSSNFVRRLLMNAKEELELNPHNDAMEPDHAHIFLCILRNLT